MAGPNEDDQRAGPGKQTGTRPKSRSQTNTSLGSASGGQSSALLSLMREYQAVTDSLALARDQIEREGQRMVVTRGAQGNTRDTVVRGHEDRNREIESLRARLLELETEVAPSNTGLEDRPSVGNISLESDNFFTRMRSFWSFC